MKKTTAIVLLLVLMLSLFGCSQPKQTQQTSQTTTNRWHAEGDILITAQQADVIIGGTFEKPRNVILIIGDGMGPNDITMAAQYGQGVYDFGLVLDRIVNHGMCTTYSASSDVTDSAAAATALSAGVKTNNGSVGLDVAGNSVKVMMETAREAGKKVGIVTDDYITGATPSGFMTHCEDRDEKDQLAASIFAMPPDVLIGRYEATHYKMAQNKGASCLTALDVSLFAKTLDEAGAIPKTFVGFNSGSKQQANNELAYCAQTALKLLENDKGFFLMIEGCGMDKYGHDNMMQGKLTSVVNLDRTVAAVLLYMQAHPDTLLIITSDHECGGVQLAPEGTKPDNSLFTATYHTGVPVRVFAVGQGSEYFRDVTVDNTDIAKFIIAALTQA